jgi:hypothetical protein
VPTNRPRPAPPVIFREPGGPDLIIVTDSRDYARKLADLLALAVEREFVRPSWRADGKLYVMDAPGRAALVSELSENDHAGSWKALAKIQPEASGCFHRLQVLRADERMGMDRYLGALAARLELPLPAVDNTIVAHPSLSVDDLARVYGPTPAQSERRDRANRSAARRERRAMVVRGEIAS